MQYSKLLQDLLQRADQLRIQSLTTHMSAPCIWAAGSDFCVVPSKGLSRYDSEFFPQRNVEKQLRFLYKTALKDSANLVGNRSGRD